jgi:hypothetical protein
MILRMRALAKDEVFHQCFRKTAVALLFALASCTLGGLNAQQATASRAKPHQQIIVKVRNGKTGMPIWVASPYVFLGTTDPQKYMDSYRRTELWTDAHVDVSAAHPREVRVWIDYIDRDCRYGDDFKRFLVFDFAGNTLRNTEAYDIDTILSTGIVTRNLCSSKIQQPEPGVLTIYVIPETLKELWNN